MNEQNGKSIPERCDYLIINYLNFKQMKKLSALLMLALLTIAVSCERNDGHLNEQPKNNIHEINKQSNSTVEPATNFTAPPEEVDPKDIVPPRR